MAEQHPISPLHDPRVAGYVQLLGGDPSYTHFIVKMFGLLGEERTVAFFTQVAHDTQAALHRKRDGTPRTIRGVFYLLAAQLLTADEQTAIFGEGTIHQPTPPDERTTRTWEVVRRIHEQLGLDQPNKTLQRLVRELGAASSLAVLHQTLDIEAAGGEQTPAGTRRAPLDVLCGLATAHLTPEQRWRLFGSDVVRHIADRLGETEDEPRHTIRRIVQLLGIDQAEALLAQTLATEAGGGMLLQDGRHRTRGGIFFKLAKGAMTQPQRWHVFWKHQQPATSAAQPSSPEERPAPALRQPREKTPITYQDGEARTVKITLVGRPGKVIPKKDYVITLMTNAKAPALPKGLPAVPGSSTTYTVYIAVKQWEKVAEAITNPDDVLIIEGWGAYEAELEGMAVWASNVTTKLLQQAKKQPAAPSNSTP